MEPVLRLLKSSKLNESAVEHPQQLLAPQTRRRWRLELNFGVQLTVVSKLWQVHVRKKLNKIYSNFKSDCPHRRFPEFCRYVAVSKFYVLPIIVKNSASLFFGARRTRCSRGSWRKSPEGGGYVPKMVKTSLASFCLIPRSSRGAQRGRVLETIRKAAPLMKSRKKCLLTDNTQLRAWLKIRLWRRWCIRDWWRFAGSITLKVVLPVDPSVRRQLGSNSQ